MKRVTRCYGCQRVTKLYGSFTAQIEEEQIIGGVNTGQKVTKIIKLCRECSAYAGYKIHEKGVKSNG